MKSYELVAKTIQGENPGITPVYAWVFDNVTDKLNERFGSVRAFEDYYALDMAHIFGGPSPYNMEEIEAIRSSGIEITPEVLLQLPLQPVDNMADYESVKRDIEFYRGQRERFCYLQTNGIFECLNGPFGIENHLCYLAMYPDELKAVYKRQAEWNRSFAMNACDLGIDMVHVSDDWGAQKNILFSPDVWRALIYPNHLHVTEAVKKRGRFVSLHSDGNINAVLDGITELGYDLIHPYQESAGMRYDTYLSKYADKFAVMGGVCVQFTLGFNDYKRLESEIRRVFSLLKGKRWVCCTTHLIQPHCSADEICFAYDLIRKLAGK